MKPAISIYAGALLLGLTLVSFPGSSAFLRASTGISDIAYGSIYLAQLVTAIVGAVLGGVAVRQMGLRRMYLITLMCLALSPALLALSSVVPGNIALVPLMCGIGFFEFAFGFGGGPLNAFLPLLFPKRASAAIVALHMTAGAGLTIGPFVIATLAAEQHWLLAPVGLAVTAITLFCFTLRVRLPAEPPKRHVSLHLACRGPHVLLWAMAAMALLYSVAEGMFSNWGMLYVSEEKGLPEAAALVLSCFWGSLTLGRLLISVAVLWVRPPLMLFVLPALIAVAFVGVSGIHSTTTALLAFAFAGLACSGFFPLLVSTAAAPYPRDVSWLASMLTAAMMVGIGSYAIGALRDSLSITVLYRYSLV